MTNKKIVNIEEIDKVYKFLGLQQDPWHYNYIIERATFFKNTDRTLSKQSIKNKCLEEIFGPRIFDNFELIKDECNTEHNTGLQGDS